jgi:hypothetical protein
MFDYTSMFLQFTVQNLLEIHKVSDILQLTHNLNISFKSSNNNATVTQTVMKFGQICLRFWNFSPVFGTTQLPLWKLYSLPSILHCLVRYWNICFSTVRILVPPNC